MDVGKICVEGYARNHLLGFEAQRRTEKINNLFCASQERRIRYRFLG